MAQGRRRRGASTHQRIFGPYKRKTKTGISYRVRYVDPDFPGQPEVWQTIPGMFVDRSGGRVSTANNDGRVAWCVMRHQELEERARDLEAGAVRKTRGTLHDALDRFFADHPRLKERTQIGYREAADLLLTFLGEAGVTSADEVRRADLVRFRTWLFKRERKDGAGLLGVTRCNNVMRGLSTVLVWCHEHELLPGLRFEEEVRKPLKPEQAAKRALRFLVWGEAQGVLRAALDHDEWAVREQESAKESNLPPNIIRRIGPFVLFSMLTGARHEEALFLKWNRVKFDKAVIALRAEDTKSKTPRKLKLAYSPMLRSLLEALREHDPEGEEVFPLAKGTAQRAKKRMIEEFESPAFTWSQQVHGLPSLRSTLAVHMVNAESMFGDAAIWKAARYLGHGVPVLQSRYAAEDIKIPTKAESLEAVLGVSAEAKRIVQAVGR